MTTYPRFTRRAALRGGMAAGTALLMTPYVRPSYAQENRLVCRDAGVGTTFQDIYARPFYEATGIEVVGVVSQTEPVGMIKQMVETQTYTWDMASGMSDAAAYQLITDGDYLETLDLSAEPVWVKVPDQFKTEHFAASAVVASCMALNTEAASRPGSWADFWNVEAFPGRRALRGFPLDTIEFALIADGVAPQDVYPCDLDRAFASLDRIKDHIDVWWANGAQSAQLLQNGEADFLNTWNGRAQPLIDGGLPIAINFNESLWGGSGFIVLKGTPKADLCRQFIAFCLEAQQQGAYSNATGYGFTNPDALAFVSEDVAPKLPTHPDNSTNYVAVDYRYWAAARAEAVDRMNAWLLD